QDDKNYYALRINGGDGAPTGANTGTIQLIRTVNGGQGVLTSGSKSGLSGEMPALNFYRLEVSSVEPYRFSARVSDINGNEIWSRAVATDGNTAAQFNGGYAGLFSSSAAGGWFNDFSIRSSVIGEE